MAKKLNDIQTTNENNLFEKTDYNTKTNRWNWNENTWSRHKLASENVTARLKETKLATKNDIGSFIEEIDFDNKLRKINNKVTLNKTKEKTVKKTKWSYNYLHKTNK